MQPSPEGGGFTRRDLLKSAAAASLAAAFPRLGFALTARPTSGSEEVLRYLASLARSDDGYAFGDQKESHLTPTFAVIGSYRLLQQMPPCLEALRQFVRTHHPRELKKLEQERRGFEFQQVQALVWLGDPAADFRERIRLWTQPLPYLKQYEKHGYPGFQSELSAVLSHVLLALPLEGIAPAYNHYIDVRRRANGSFNNTPASDGGDGHVMNTLWGLQARGALGRPEDKRDETIEWLRSCQLPSGGFTYQPNAVFGGVDDVGYTRSALRALGLLGGAPASPSACVDFIHSLANADGGFSDRPGWLSNPTATYYALDALDALGALDSLAGISRRPLRPRQTLPAGLKIFSIQIEAHGQGSPAEAVDLARGLRIDLWGAKNAVPAWLARAQAIADQQGVPTTFFPANEEYGTWVDVPGLGTYSHTSDIVAPPHSDFGASLAQAGVVSWPEFRERRLAPLVRAGGRLIWQFGENEELVRPYLDDSVTRGGYAAISTYHFGNPDFTNTEPFLNRWRGQIPYIALQDAHGPEPWWFADTTTGTRTLFLGTEPTWDAWLNALQKNWVVAVRHDAVSRQHTWMHSGSDEVLDWVRARESEWRWWDNPAVKRPLVSIVAVSAADEFEVGRPKSGVSVRVRCAWENTPQGVPTRPITEFVKLTVDGAEVSPEIAAGKVNKNGAATDHYHHLWLAAPAAGKHTATATVRMVATGVEASRTIEFRV